MAKAKYTRGADGYFKTNVWDGTYTAAGQKHRIALRSRKSSRDLENVVAEHNAKLKSRELIQKTEITFLEYARSFVEVFKSTRQNNTRAMYDNIVKKHFVILAGVKLQDISRSHYQMCINNARDKARTQQQIRMVFRQVMESAVVDRYLPAGADTDFFRGLDAIKYKAAPKRPLLPHERKAVFAADLDPQDKALVYILYGRGLRREEVMALTVFDFDLKHREVQVNKAHEYTSYGNYQAVVKDPKSHNGSRTVPIPEKVFPEIEKYVLSLRSSGRVYLFTMRGGKPPSKSSYDNSWGRILRKLNEVSEEPVEGLTAHIFRHNYCTELCYQIPKISIKKIAELIGDSEKMVLDVYNHVLNEKEDTHGVVNSALNF